MICPKCGYEQEERLDCIKCGIVFSKYMALHLGGKQNRPEPFPQISIPEALPEETMAPELLDLRQSLREVQRRLGDVEFERAERALIKNELKSLDQRIQGLLEPLASRISALEARLDLLAQAPPPPSRDDMEKLRGQLLADLDNSSQSHNSALEVLEQKCLEQSRDSSAELSGRIGILESSAETSRQQEAVLSKQLQELETAVTAQAQELNAFASQPSEHKPSAEEAAWMEKTAARIMEVEEAVLKIRREAAQTAEQMEILQAMLSAHAQEVKALKFESIEGKMTPRERESITRALTQLEALEGTLFEINKGSVQASERLDAQQQGLTAQALDINTLKEEIPPLAATLINLRESVTDWSARNSDLEKHVAKLEVQVLEMEGKTKDLRESILHNSTEARPLKSPELTADDVGTIKQDLGQIREFMKILMTKF